MKFPGVCATVLLVVLASVGSGAAVATTADADADWDADGDDTLTVHYINTEAGVSTLVVGPTGETMLVDTAGHGGEEQVLAYLRRADVDRIDHLVATHGHGGHVGGHEAVIEFFESERDGVGAVYDPGLHRTIHFYEAYLDAVDEHDVDRIRLRRGDDIPLEGASVSVLSPPADNLEDGDFNENSLVLRVEHGDASFLLLGDAETAAEEFLLEAEREALDATVLQASKEGSDDGNGEAFLEAVSPAAVVVNGGAHDADRPAPAVLDRLDRRDLPTYWTASHGTTVMESDGRQVSVATQRDATTDPSALRDADPVPPGANEPIERIDTLLDESERDDGTTETETATPTETPTGTGTGTATTPTVTDTPVLTTATPTPTDAVASADAGTSAPARTSPSTDPSETAAGNGSDRAPARPGWVWQLIAVIVGATAVPLIARQ